MWVLCQMVLVKSKSDTYRAAVMLLDILFLFFSAGTSCVQKLEMTSKRKFNMPRILEQVHAKSRFSDKKRELISKIQTYEIQRTQ